MKAVLLSLVIGLMVSVNAMAECPLKAMNNAKSRFDNSGNAYNLSLNRNAQQAQDTSLQAVERRQ